MKPYAEQSYYELLEVSPTAKIEEIRAAYQRATRLYGSESATLPSAGDPERAGELKKLLLQAVEVLSNPDLRAQYDNSLRTASSAQAPGLDGAPDENPVRSNAVPSNGDARNGVPAVPRDPNPPMSQPADGLNAGIEHPVRHRLSTTQRTHSSSAGFSVSYLSKPSGSTARANPSRSNEILSASRLSLGPPTAAGPELRSLAPALPLPSNADASAAPEKWFVASATAYRAHAPAPNEILDESHTTGTGALHPEGGHPRSSTESSASSSAKPDLASGASTAPSLGLAEPNGASRATAHPASGSFGASPPAFPRPPIPRRVLDSAPVLAQESAIADAESALAQAHAQVALRTREPRPRAVDIPPDAVFNGELLRYVRKARGMTLQILAERTRIATKHIENLEADRYESLPATVYLRGIVMSVARELGLDPLRVSKGYLALVEKQIGRK